MNDYHVVVFHMAFLRFFLSSLDFEHHFLPSVYKALHGAIAIMRSFAEDEDTLPINVAMELRFTKHSDSRMSPAYGQEVTVTYVNGVWCCFGPGSGDIEAMVGVHSWLASLRSPHH